ncbi:PEP-utilizing enzyme [Streptomyces cirratus]
MLIARDLAPADTERCSTLRSCWGFVSPRKRGPTSHSAILARALGCRRGRAAGGL